MHKCVLRWARGRYYLHVSYVIKRCLCLARPSYSQCGQACACPVDCHADSSAIVWDRWECKRRRLSRAAAHPQDGQRLRSRRRQDRFGVYRSARRSGGDRHDDGTRIIWRSKFSGSSEVHATIDGAHRWFSQPHAPDVNAARPVQVSDGGRGSRPRLCWEARCLLIKFLDEYSNTATPGASLKIHVAWFPIDESRGVRRQEGLRRRTHITRQPRSSWRT